MFFLHYIVSSKLNSKLLQTFISFYASHMQTQMFWWSGHSLPFSTPCVASHKRPTFCDPVPNEPGRKRLWCTRVVCLFESDFYSRVVKTVDSPSLLQKRTSSEMGVTQVPMVCCLNTELYYTAISHHVVSAAAQGLCEIQGFLSVCTLTHLHWKRKCCPHLGGGFEENMVYLLPHIALYKHTKKI